MPSTNAAIGQRIRSHRWLRGMSQSQFAEFVGVSFQQVQKYETGKNRISAVSLAKLADAIDCPVSQFFPSQDIPTDGLSRWAVDIAIEVDALSEDSRRIVHSIVQYITTLEMARPSPTNGPAR